MPVAEYRCRACGQEYEYLFTVEQWPYPESFSCVGCHGEAVRYFSRPPGMSPDPYWTGVYDVQAGRTFNSRAEKMSYLKSKGLEEVSAEEHERSLGNYREKEDVIPPNDPKLREAMEKAYADTVAGNIPPVEPRKVDTSDYVVVS